jgi:hypothetical protein
MGLFGKLRRVHASYCKWKINHRHGQSPKPTYISLSLSNRPLFLMC